MVYLYFVMIKQFVALSRVHADCESKNEAAVLFAINFFAVATVKLLHSHHLPLFDCFLQVMGENTL